MSTPVTLVLPGTDPAEKAVSLTNPLPVLSAVGGAAASPTNPVPSELGPYSYSRKTADGQVKGAAGALHTVSIAPVGAVTAGVLTIYDSLTETGTVIFSVALPITSFSPFTITLDAAFATGLFCAFDATLANVQATFSYR